MKAEAFLIQSLKAALPVSSSSTGARPQRVCVGCTQHTQMTKYSASHRGAHVFAAGSASVVPVRALPPTPEAAHA
eukprot:6457474-Amphidinium_carterae.1